MSRIFVYFVCDFCPVRPYTPLPWPTSLASGPTSQASVPARRASGDEGHLMPFLKATRSIVLSCLGDFELMRELNIVLSIATSFPKPFNAQPAQTSSTMSLNSASSSSSASESPESLIHRLPPELLERIFGSMPFENVAMTRLVCHRFNRSCQSILNQVSLSGMIF